MLWYILAYTGTSLLIGFGIALINIWRNREIFHNPRCVAQNGEKWLDDGVKRGHLQKTILDQRIVYHENDIQGQIMVRVNQEMRLMAKERPRRFFLWLLIINGIREGVSWPRTLYLYIKGRSV